MHAWVNVATLTKTKNLKGGLVARSAPGLPFLLEEGLEVAFVPPQHDAPRRARVESVREDGRDAYLVCFEEIDAVDVSERLVGCSCLVRKEDVPEEALLGADDGLVGFALYDVRTGLVGEVSDIIDSPAQTLLSVVRVDGSGEVLVPLVDDFLESWDENERRIDMNLPDGLLSL